MLCCLLVLGTSFVTFIQKSPNGYIHHCDWRYYQKQVVSERNPPAWWEGDGKTDRILKTHCNWYGHHSPNRSATEFVLTALNSSQSQGGLKRKYVWMHGVHSSKRPWFVLPISDSEHRHVFLMTAIFCYLWMKMKEEYQSRGCHQDERMH